MPRPKRDASPPASDEDDSSDPFELLGIESNATMVEVMNAWKHLMLRFHPDKNDASRKAEFTAKSQALNNAKDKIVRMIEKGMPRFKKERSSESSQKKKKPTAEEAKAMLRRALDAQEKRLQAQYDRLVRHRQRQSAAAAAAAAAASGGV